MNIYLKSATSLLKIIVLFILAYLFVGIFFAENTIQLAIGIFILIFITLPTINIIFFSKKFPWFHKIWKIYRFFYAIFIVLYIAAWILGVWHLNAVAQTQKAIDFINSKKITIDDVMGKNLPPQLDQKLNDSTIAGIDVNKNYIRDDVELAIFKEYPNSAKIRAAELQYAQALQLELTRVSSSETFDCLGYSGPDTSLGAANKKEKEVTDLIMNTDLRRKDHSEIFKKYMAGYASLPGSECNIDLSSLPD